METAAALPLQQHPKFAKALAYLGQDTSCCDIDGAAPLLVVPRFGVGFSSRGPIWSNPPTEQACHDLRRSKVHLINSNGGDESALTSAGYRLIMTRTCVAEWPLLPTREARLAGLKGKWRNTLRRGQRAGMTLQREAFDARRHAWLLREDRKQQRVKKFRSLPHPLISAYAAANPKCTPVFVAYNKGNPIAALLFLLHGKVATYHLGWTSEVGRRLAAHHCLLMHAADVFSNRSIERVDLGLVDTVNTPGLARFKIGTGAEIRSLGGTWLRIPGL